MPQSARAVFTQDTAMDHACWSESQDWLWVLIGERHHAEHLGPKLLSALTPGK